MEPKHKLQPWSYSSLSTFKQCPYRYYREKVLKDIPREPDSEAILYGVALHKAAEDYIGEDKPIPPQFSYIQSYLDKLKAIPGEKFVERKMGITKKDGVLEPCDFFSPDVWYRGVADLLIVDHEKHIAYVVDYKTGKSSKYADPLQLQLMAACVFLLYPDVQRVKGMLLFVVCRDIIKTSYPQAERLKVFENLDFVLHRRTVAYETGVFNKTQNGLCRNYCPVLDCEFNGRR
jgi:CRISPR/Cas system-associated exonuclease Cas4 (RecB family)